MSVLTCQEQNEGRSASADQNGIRQYTRVWRIVTSDPLDDAKTVASAPGLPVLFDPYVTDTGSDNGARAIAVEAQPESDNPQVWTVVVKYSSATADDLQAADNPLDRPAVVSIGFSKFRSPVEKDIHDNAIKNSAGETFDPVPEKDDARLILRVKKNVGSFDPIAAKALLNQTNDDTFFGAPAGKLKLSDLRAEKKHENDQEYWELDCEFELKDDWSLTLLDQGFSTLVSGVRRPYFDDTTGQPPTRPILLDGAGGKTTTPHYLTWTIYEQGDFSILDLE